MLIAAAFVQAFGAAPFPTSTSLPACIGAALIIVSGSREDPTLGHRILGMWPMRSIGLISYGVYLFHWPVYVFMRHVIPEAGTLELATSSAVISILSSVLSYVALERPVRYGFLSTRNLTTLAVSATASAAVAAVALTVVVRDGYPHRFNQLAVRYADYLKPGKIANFGPKGCFRNIDENYADIDLGVCLPLSSGRHAVVWGDSGIAQYAEALKSKFRAIGYDLGQLTASGCPPVLDVDVPERPQCRTFNDLVIATLAERKPDLVILGEVWAGPEVNAHVEETIKRLSAIGSKVVILGPGPRFVGDPVPRVMAERVLSGNADLFTDAKMWHRTVIAVLEDKLKDAISRSGKDVNYISMIDALCAGGPCLLSNGQDPIFVDFLHVTDVGAEFHVRSIFPLIERSVSK